MNEKKVEPSQELIDAQVKRWTEIATTPQPFKEAEALAAAERCYKAAGLALPGLGFHAVGSPKAARLRLIDELRKQGQNEDPPFQYLGIVGWSSWACDIDTWEKAGLEAAKDEKFYCIRDLLLAGVWQMFAYGDDDKGPGICLVVPTPKEIYLDDKGLVHRIGAPALRWADGFDLSAVHRIPIPNKVWSDPDGMTAAEILGIQHTESRRATIEQLGWARCTKAFGAVEADKMTDPVTGLGYRLLQLNQMPSDFRGRLLEMQSPVLKDGSQPLYHELVPADCTTALAARWWRLPGPDGKYMTAAQANKLAESGAQPRYPGNEA